MTAPPGFDRLLSPTQGPADVLALTDNEPLTRVCPPTAAAWRLYSGAVTLRRAGHASEVSSWFNDEAAVIRC